MQASVEAKKRVSRNDEAEPNHPIGMYTLVDYTTIPLACTVASIIVPELSSFRRSVVGANAGINDHHCHGVVFQIFCEALADLQRLVGVTLLFVQKFAVQQVCGCRQCFPQVCG